jgi:general secretion pathway protein E
MAGPAGRVDAAPAGPGVPRPRRRLGEVLVDAGVLSAKSLEEALAAQAGDQGQRRKLGEVIVGLGLADETQIAQALSTSSNCPSSTSSGCSASPTRPPGSCRGRSPSVIRPSP